MVSREYDGLAGAGGVKDVCRQLAEALVEHGGCAVRVIIPRYGFMEPRSLGFKPLSLPGRQPVEPCPGSWHRTFDVDMNYVDENRREAVSIWQNEIQGVTVFLAEAERFAEKLGVYAYTAEEEKRHSWQRQGMGHYDYFAMNILLQKSAIALMILLDERPDVIHCQDGHAAVLPAMLREHEGYSHFFRHSGCVVTVHNAGIGYHQDVADLEFAAAVTGLPDRVIRANTLNGSFDPFIAAADYAVLNTVSEQYARELQETDEDVRTGGLGHGLLQRGVRLAGITNGINPQDFDPTEPEKLGLPAAFDVAGGHLEGKRVCKETLIRSLNRVKKRARVVQHGSLAAKPEQPLFTFVGRLTLQKGVDLLVQSLESLLAEDAGFQTLILGSGAPEFEARLIELAGGDEFGGRICFLQGYDPDLALQVYAAGDFFLIPSLYEPCGLTDYIAQLFGNLPIVHYVGGLVKVIDGTTGFAYQDHTPSALGETMWRAMTLYRSSPAGIKTMQQAAVLRIYEHHTWEKVVGRYLELYEQARMMVCRY
ncbi:MAG TPA: glycogen synthase [Desulfobacteraceae bacterium]|nr:glycogen synthase [Desulfobacteraceae bacterium]